MDKEKWITIEDFPNYAVSNHGRVMNLQTDLIKTPTPNQQGIPSVLLVKDHRQYRKAVPLLVAKHFIPPHKNKLFISPINLDGDRFNNYWRNIEWRPRWFAMAYHHQFMEPIPFGFSAKLMCIETHQVFDSIVECVQEYGLLMKDVINSVHTQTPVFPTWQTFMVVEK